MVQVCICIMHDCAECRIAEIALVTPWCRFSCVSASVTRPLDSRTNSRLVSSSRSTTILHRCRLVLWSSSHVSGLKIYIILSYITSVSALIQFGDGKGISLSILTVIIPDGPELDGTRNVSILDFVVAKDDGSGGDNCSHTTCKAPVK